MQVLDCRVDCLLHGPHPPSASSLPRQIEELYAEHSCFPHLAGSNPYLRYGALHSGSLRSAARGSQSASSSVGVQLLQALCHANRLWRGR